VDLIFRKSPQGRGARWDPPSVGSSFADSGLCGASANAGILRFHDDASGPVGQSFINSTFATDGLLAEVFAYDWLARQFAVSSNLSPEGNWSSAQRTVVVLSPFDMSVTPWIDVDRFLEALEFDMAIEFLEPDLFEGWLRKEALGALPLDRCAGATVPGFYKGSLALSNLVNNDLDVYLTFIAELWNKTKNSPAGSPPPKLRYPE
jgi:hypothetical protein